MDKHCVTRDYMGRKKQFDVQVYVSLPKELGDWLQEQIRLGVFASMSHGIRRCIILAKEKKGVKQE